MNDVAHLQRRILGRVEDRPDWYGRCPDNYGQQDAILFDSLRGRVHHDGSACLQEGLRQLALIIAEAGFDNNTGCFGCLKRKRLHRTMRLVTGASDNRIRFSALSPSILNREDRLRVGRQILAVLEDHLRSTGLGDRRVLDVWCSSGIITSFLAQFSGSIVGVDVDTDALRLAQEEPRKPNLDFRAMSGSALDFAAASFDIVVCNQVYYWLDDPDALMAEIYRILTPGGVCFFASVNKYAPWEAQYRLPFLSFLPQPLANLYVRAAGRGERFGCRYLSFWGLTQLCRAFIVHRYTARVLQDPIRFHFTRLAKLKKIFDLLPTRWCEFLEPLSPNFVWILEKPSSPGSMTPATRAAHRQSGG